MDGMNHQHQSGQPATAAAPGAVQQQQQQPQQTAAQLLPPHLIGLMTNPALAAAAAASPLFPPAAMLSNPGAYLAMPEAFNVMNNLNNAAGGQQQQHSTTAASMQAQMLQQLAGGFQAAAAAAAASGNHTTGAVVANNNNSNNITPLAPLVAAFHQNPAFAMPLAPPVANNNNGGNLSSNTSDKNSAQRASRTGGSTGTGATSGGAAGTNDSHLTPEEKARQNRDRNREHARSTRLRKKAYVQKLKELVEGLHAERTEEVRQRRVAIQHLAEVQNVRRNVVSSFLRFHSNYETEARKWSTILEEDFWLKQPVTPYRSFRRAEIEQECRIVRGIEAMICDSASLAVMIESIGSRSPRWMQIKREEFLLLEEQQRGTRKMPRCIVRQDSRLHHAVSSLSSSSAGSSSNHHHHNNGNNNNHHAFSSSGEDSGKNKRGHHTSAASAHGAAAPKQLGLLKVSGGVGNTNKNDSISAGQAAAAVLGGQKVSLSSHSRNINSSNQQQQQQQDGLHDYHAKPLPDPKLRDSEGSSEMAEDSNASSAGDTKRVSTDSSSGDDSAGPRATKKRKVGSATGAAGSEHGSNNGGATGGGGSSCPLPPNVAKKGGIPHNIQPVLPSNETARLSLAPAVALPPFSGIGKRNSGSASSSHGMSSTSSVRKEARTETVQHEATTSNSGNHHHHHHHNRQASSGGPAVIAADADCSSISSGSKGQQIRGYYHINEDDMILMEDVMMCPFIFRSQDAVLCGALAECVMPGMLRAAFSSRNKLQSLELVYDAMGFMQQLERASGNEGTAQIIPGSLEMALSPSTTEALVITLAEPPFLIVNVNEVWTRTTGYTQMQVEGQEYMSLLEGEGTVTAASNRPGKPRHCLEDVANGRCSCSTNIHYDKDGRDFIEFVCSYPLTNANDEVTHLLHVSKELPSFPESTMIGTGSR